MGTTRQKGVQMQMDRSHLVTGATGFIGGACVLELLDKTDDAIVCLVRANSASEATERIHRSLEKTASSYGMEELFDRTSKRVSAVAGDITDLDHVESRALLEGVSNVWHSAASLKYRDRDSEEINLCNVGGTRTVLDLAEEIGAEDFVYVSTAYVAGSASGHYFENQDMRSEPNNEYERSKRGGESEVMSSTSKGLRTVVVRPAVVVGHSISYAAYSTMGLYGFTDALMRVRLQGPPHLRCH